MTLLTSASSVASAYWGDHWGWELGLSQPWRPSQSQWPVFLFSFGTA